VDRIPLSAIFATVLIIVIGIILVSLPRTDMSSTEKTKPAIKNITIGVIPGYEETLPTYKLLTSLAQDDINKYCVERGLNFRFRFNLSDPIYQTEQALTYTKAFRAAGVDMILGYAWSSHLCSGARVYGYNKTMVLMTPSARSSIYSLRNDTLYHLCVLEVDPIETTLKAMRDRGVKAYLLIYNPNYGSSDSLVTLIQHTAKSPKFEENQTITYSYDTPINNFLSRADSALERMISIYGRSNTAVLWLSFPSDVGPGGEQFLAEAANTTSLSSVNWYLYDDTSSRGAYNGVSEVPSKLRLISLEMVLKPNPTYDRLNRIWVNSTNSHSPLGYYDANIYDGLWILSLSAIRANSTKPLDIMKVLPSVASDYVGATGRCTLDDTGARAGADYDVYAYFEVEGRTRSLLCGSYRWGEGTFIWDNGLLGDVL
jgi:ABC-type branched-subunit amino acid transport system substrate-binding protein